MLALSSSLVRRSIPRLVEEVSRPDGVRKWLLEGAYALAPESNQNEIILTEVEPGNFLPYLCYDYERFALSSWETFSLFRLERSAANTLGWPFLKLYYSAFFAAHAIIRATGQATMRLERDQADFLSDFSELVFDQKLSIPTGTFQLKSTQSIDGLMQVRLVRLSDSGGAHEGFWKQFYLFISELQASIASSGEPNASDAVVSISELARILRFSPGTDGTWLSVLRNKINYQHDYDLWFPVRGSHRGFEAVDSAVFKSSSAIRLDMNPRRTPLQAFGAANHMLATLNFDVAESFSAKSPQSRLFGGKWKRLRASLRDGATADVAA